MKPNSDAQLIDATNEMLAQVIKTINQFPNIVDKTKLLETLTQTLQNSFVPTSGMTIQQHVSPAPELINALHEQMNRKPNPMVDNKEYKNTLAVYHWSRVAASGGIVPSYMDKEGNIYIGLICNKRALHTYNWSAGYTEAPLARWTDTFQPIPEQDLKFDLPSLIKAGKEVLIEQMQTTRGDFTKLEFKPEEIEAAYKKRGVERPPEDNSGLATGKRELKEEMGLDLTQFPNAVKFLISWDDTLGISQGDAPGQLSNRNHQFGYFLGVLDQPPQLIPGDDVGVADWIKLSDIERNPNDITEYVATNDKNEKRPLSIYMLPALEKYFQMLWSHLVQTSSLKQNTFGNPIAKYPDLKTLALDLHEKYGKLYSDDSSFKWFCRYLAGESACTTFTGKLPSLLLPGILKISKALAQDEHAQIETSLTETLNIIKKYLSINTVSIDNIHGNFAIPNVNNTAEIVSPASSSISITPQLN